MTKSEIKLLKKHYLSGNLTFNILVLLVQRIDNIYYKDF